MIDELKRIADFLDTIHAKHDGILSVDKGFSNKNQIHLNEVLFRELFDSFDVTPCANQLQLTAKIGNTEVFCLSKDACTARKSA